MALQFIRGTAEQDLQTQLVKEALDWLEKDDANEVFYLVPNHIKFEQEIDVLRKIKETTAPSAESIASMRLQVFSFYRLAWYFLQNSSYYRLENLSEAGAAMIFRKVLLENEEELTVFRGEINQTGFIKQLYDLYLEVKEGNIELERLAFEEFVQENKDLNLKFKDLVLLFQQFEAKLEHFGLKSPEMLIHLANYLTTQDLSKTLFIVHGYEQFTARELELLRILIEKSAGIKISLVLNNQWPVEQPPINDLFFDAGRTYYLLYQAARELKVPILADIVLSNKKMIVSEEIITLLHFWENRQLSTETKSAINSNRNEQLQIWKAESAKEEISHIAKEIRRLVHEESYRYAEIQLLTRDVSMYEDMLAPIFAMNNIPFYLDRQMSMEQHPLVEFIHSLFAVESYHYRYRDVLRFLRTELFFPEATEESLEGWLEQRNEWRRKIDITENVVLAYGYEGYHWTSDTDWQFISYDFETDELDETTEIQEESNEVRRSVQQLLPRFFKRMAAAKNGVEAAKIFYRFLINCGVEQQLNLWRIQAIEKGRLDEARNHEQTWEALMLLLDEYVTIYGADKFEFDVFQEILSSGLEGLRYSKVPTAIDQVQIGSIDLAFSGQAKVVFAIGLTEQALPQVIENKTLFSDEDRMAVNEHLAENRFLAYSAGKKIAKEPFVAYTLFSAATERLYLTYPSTRDTETEVKMSSYLEIIKQNLGIEPQLKQAVQITDEASESLRQISTYRILISDLTSLFRQKKESGWPLSDFWLNMQQLLSKQPEFSLARIVFSSLNHQNIPVSLTNEQADELYGKDIYTSVSKMESFYRCQYQYFSRFGLNLKEREHFTLSSAATGEFFHDALDQFFKLLFSKNIQLTALSDKEVYQFTEEVLASVFGDVKFNILSSSNRMNYIRYQLSQTIKRVCWALKRQSHASGLTPVQTEVLFGQIAGKKGIKGLELPLNNQGKLNVRGKIDRVDQLVTENETYLGIVDYKSSQRKFNISEAYYGLAMQMLTYLDVALMDAVQLVGKTAKPAGSLYLHVHNPTLSYETEEKIEKNLLKKFQFDGLLVNDPELLSHLDESLAPKSSSLIYPIEESAKEIIKPGRRQENKFVTENELDALIHHNRSKLIEAGNQITSGEIELNPAYQGKERIACKYCPFRSVCTFDVMLKENNYHRLEQLSKKEVLERLMEQPEEGESNE